MTTRVLGLGTYPVVKPVHGGQRRVTAFKTFYERIGIQYDYACIFDPNHYKRDLVGPNDIPLIAVSSEEGPVSVIGDVLSGRQAATDENSFQHFRNVLDRFRPDALQLEHPFMWPLAKRLREEIGQERLPLIYSSHNVEAPLKDEILSVSGIAGGVRRRICDSIEEMEAEVCRAAALIACVSASEQKQYLRYQPSAERVIVVPNGVDRPPTLIPQYAPCSQAFAQRPFAFMVGSAYAPNIDGFCEYVLSDGAFMMPPVKSMALCGGVCRGILDHPRYQRFGEANSRRIQFFPDIEDAELWAIKKQSHAALLPIGTGRGSNLKTAEALVLGKWVIATSIALRGYERFLEAEGLIIANDSVAFRRAIGQALRSAPPTISEKSRQAREVLYWDRCFADSGWAQSVTSPLLQSGQPSAG